jgi:hypothetical protein
MTRLAARVTPEARRAVRAFKESIAPDAERIKVAIRGWALPAIHDWMKMGSLNRERKLSRIKNVLAPAAVDNCGGGLTVMWLECHGQLVLVDDPRFRQDCVLVVGAVGTRLRGAIRWASFPIFEAPDHMLARAFQRSPGIDAAAALYEASISFLRADRRALRFDETLYLPTGPGLSLTLPIFLPDLEGRRRLIARAFTWIGEAQAAPDQTPVCGGG